MRFGHRDPVPEALRGAVIALGNFDGFHLGHQAVVREAVEWARSEGRPAVVATFDPHPVRHFAPHVPWFRLTSLDQRQRQEAVEMSPVGRQDGVFAACRLDA